MTILAFLIACPMAWWAIWYDNSRDHEWPRALKWAFILSMLLLFTVSTALDAQMVSDINWCSQVSGFWYYAGGCFLPGM